MDAISIVQTVIPFCLAIIFTCLSVMDIKEMVSEKAQSVFAPIWCFLAFICWVTFGIVNLYATTLDYFAGLAWLYVSIGLLFFPVLFIAAILLNLRISGDMKEANEMKLQ